jgi:hypothetical protein
MANSLFYGTGIDSKKYGFKASDTAYPSALLTLLGLTKLAANGTLPTDVTLLPNNQIKGYFARIYCKLGSGKTRTKFICADKASSANALLGQTLSGSKIIGVLFTA